MKHSSMYMRSRAIPRRQRHVNNNALHDQFVAIALDEIQKRPPKRLGYMPPYIEIRPSPAEMLREAQQIARGQVGEWNRSIYRFTNEERRNLTAEDRQNLTAEERQNLQNWEEFDAWNARSCRRFTITVGGAIALFFLLAFLHSIGWIPPGRYPVP